MNEESLNRLPEDNSLVLDDEMNDDNVLFPETATEEQKLENLKRKLPHLFVVRVMSEGDSFGEIALQNNTRRCSESLYL